MTIAEQQAAIEANEQTSIVTDEVKLFYGSAREANDLREELESERDLRLRLAAEFDNYRRRVRREQAEAADSGKRELLEGLIPVLDDMDLAVANMDGTSDAVAESLRLTQRRFIDLLQANDVVSFKSEGERFDPERHEAFDVVRDSESESGTVHSELRRGYLWKDKLLRPALVVVAM